MTPFELFCNQLQADPELLWTWHCNIAMVAVDAGADPIPANERAADFMNLAFGADPRQTEYWQTIFPDHGKQSS